MSDVVLLSREDDIATVTLNRPDRLNALDKAMWQRLAAIMTGISGDGAVRCVILRGAGPAFGAGADVAEFVSERDTPAKAAAYAEIMGAALSALRGCPVPTVAQIHGACAGRGSKSPSIAIFASPPTPAGSARRYSASASPCPTLRSRR